MRGANTNKRRALRHPQASRRKWMMFAAAAVAGLAAVWLLTSRPPGQSHSARPAPPPADAADLDRSLRNEQLQAAEKLVRELPQDDDAIYLAGCIHQEQGDTARAMQLWEKSLALDPSRADAHDSLGYALLLRDQYAEAEKHLRQALALNPNLPSARYHLAQVASHQGKHEVVVEALGSGRDLSADSQRLLGEAYLHMKYFGKATNAFNAAVRLNPQMAEAHYGLSRVHALLGDKETAAGHLAAFTKLKQAAEERGREVRASYDPLAITRQNVAKTHTDVGRVLANRQRLAEAETLWLKAARLDPSNSLCRLQLAILCQHRQQPRQALEWFESVLAISPEDPLLHLNMGRVLQQTGEFDRAEKAFQQVIRLAPNRAEGHLALAELYLRAQRNFPKALTLAETAVRLDPEPVQYSVLAQARAMIGDRPGALAAVDQGLQLDPASQACLQTRARLLASPK